MKKILLFSLIFWFTFNLQAQLNSTQVDQLVENAIEKFGIAGAAIAIVKDGKIIHNKGYGIKSIETKEKVNQHTNFAIASNSKAFTSAALAILIEEGKLNWQDKVVEYIPEFTMYNDYVTQNFNIQDLLTHRSGLGLGAGDLMFFPDGGDFTIDDVLNVFQHFEPQSAFRTKWDYDNLLYIVAGEIIKRVSGMTWEAFVEKRIMRPIGMEQSYASLDNISDRSNVASPHSDESGSLKSIGHYVFDRKKMNGAPGAIYANVDDLSQWMILQLNQGKYGEQLKQTLFSAANHQEMWKVHTVMNHNPSPRYNTHFSGYGLGWFITDQKGNLIVSHTGGLPGMLSKIILVPDQQLGIAILTNTSNGGGGVFESVTRSIVDSYLELSEVNWVEIFHNAMVANQSRGDEISKKVWETTKTANISCINLQDYVGVYEDKWFGKVEVYFKEDQLWMTATRSPRLTGQMHFYKANAFAVKWEYQDMNADAFAIFSLDEEGRAERIRMKGISPNIDFSFDFQDLDLKRVE